jgi:uncharacterized protein YlxW (UPF0749 family)
MTDDRKPGENPPATADDEPTVVQLPSPTPAMESTAETSMPETRAEAADRPAGVGPGETTRRLAPDDLDGPTRRLTPDLDGPTQRLPPPVEPAPEPVSPDEPLSSERVTQETPAPGVPEEAAEPEVTSAPEPDAKPAPWRRLSSAGALIWVLLALFGFTLVVQLRSNDGDQGLASTRQEDLVRILSDLEARDSRLQSEINALETSQRQLTSGVAGRQVALEEAEKRRNDLGLLAGTLAARGPGLSINLDRVKASAVLNAVQELRGAGGEVMQIGGTAGGTVRIVASSYFVDAEGGGIIVDGVHLTGPFTVLVIGVPQTMQTALQIPGGVVASVSSNGGSVTMEQRSTVEVTAVRKATTLQYARPAS